MRKFTIKVTHCIRPQDVVHRRAVIILRRVYDDAPRLTAEECDRVLGRPQAYTPAPAPGPWMPVSDRRASGPAAITSGEVKISSNGVCAIAVLIVVDFSLSSFCRVD